MKDIKTFILSISLAIFVLAAFVDLSAILPQQSRAWDTQTVSSYNLAWD